MTARRRGKSQAGLGLGGWHDHTVASTLGLRRPVTARLLQLALLPLLCSALLPFPSRAQDRIAWPDDKLAAVSLSFDDSRDSQLDTGMALLEELGVRATFYVVPERVRSRLPDWQRLARAGHEIGNHSLRHPCTGNFAWSRQSALEDYSLSRMRSELVEASAALKELLGVAPSTFAYPCGQTFVGRGRGTRSYVPLVAELFVAGRGWLDETATDPLFHDPAQVPGMSMDAKDFPEVRALVDGVRKAGGWLVLAGHDFGESGPQTTRVAMLEKLVPYLQARESRVWLATVEAVARYIADRRASR